MLSTTVGADCEVIAQELRGALSSPGEHVVQLRFVATGFAVDVVAEGALVADLVSRLVGRPFRVPPIATEAVEPSEPNEPNEPDAALTGAFAALAVDLGRRCNGDGGGARESEPVRLRGSRLGPAFIVEQTFTVLVEGRPYSAAIRFTAPDSPLKTKPTTLDAVNPGLHVSLPLVGGLSWVPRDELSTLRAGDIWGLGMGPDLETRERERDAAVALSVADGVLSGRCALAAPGGTMGFVATLQDASTLVVGSRLVALPLDVDDVDVNVGEEPLVAEEKPKTPGLEDAVLSAPVVVRVELGSVGMTVQEWSELRAGDVIQCGRRVGANAELRVGGAVVARGELVNVEGELGVRIVELLDAGA